MNWTNHRADCTANESAVESPAVTRTEPSEPMLDGTRNARRAPVTTWINPRDASVMRLIPAGAFIMGSTPEQLDVARHMDIYGHEFSLLDEIPQFCALLTDYYLGECAVTNEQFANFLNDFQPAPAELRLLAPTLERIHISTGGCHAYEVETGFERHPVIHVSWFGAEEYCKWAGLRLPTEMEWDTVIPLSDAASFERA